MSIARKRRWQDPKCGGGLCKGDCGQNSLEAEVLEEASKLESR